MGRGHGELAEEEAGRGGGEEAANGRPLGGQEVAGVRMRRARSRARRVQMCLKIKDVFEN